MTVNEPGRDSLDYLTGLDGLNRCRGRGRGAEITSKSVFHIIPLSLFFTQAGHRSHKTCSGHM